MSDLAFNIWGVIASVIGTILALLPLFTLWVRPRLPSATILDLCAVLKETKALFSAALDEGLITDEHEIRQIRLSMEMYVYRHYSLHLTHMALMCMTRSSQLRAAAYLDGLCGTVYAATSYPQSLRNWWNGVSSRIAELYAELNVVRVKLAVSLSSRGCCRRHIRLPRFCRREIHLSGSFGSPRSSTLSFHSTLVCRL